MLKKVFRYGKENNIKTVLSLLVLILAVIFQTLPFVFVYQVIHKVIGKAEITPEFILFSSGGVLLSLIIYSFLYTKGLDISHKAAYGTLMNLRVSLQEKMEKLPLGVIDERGTGAFKKIFVDDIESLELLYAHAIPEGSSNLFVVIVVYIFLFVFSWKLAFLAAVTIPMGFIAMKIMYSLGMKYMDAYYKAGRFMNNTIIEYVHGMEVVKVFNKSSESYEKLKNSVIGFRDYTLLWYKVCWPMMAVYGAVLPCTLFANLPIGSYLVISGFVELEEYVLVLCLSLSLGIPLLRALTFIPTFPQIAYKIEQIEKIMGAPPLKESCDGFNGKDHRIEYRDVTFGYGEKEVLHNINLTIEPGSSTALVGESGSGKSTLAKLLVHYYDVKSGQISIGGQNITDISLESLNELVSYVSQDNFLFNMSLMENIRLGKPDATDEEVMEAAKKAQCGFIKKMPRGFDTPAGDAGNQLSGGEKQRITLARAILKDAPIVVLDEATAFSDPENEEKIASVLAEFIKKKTLVIIAHRLSTVKNASQICVLKDGEIVERGTHEELLENGHEYKKLWLSHVKSMEWGITKEEEL
ncbi:MAG: ABC transporter ATP-binding protein [Spirochaetales bacterium]|nr:ABC transporter ATP-binding protein [Spirochaetales bacterium]